MMKQVTLQADFDLINVCAKVTTLSPLPSWHPQLLELFFTLLLRIHTQTFAPSPGDLEAATRFFPKRSFRTTVITWKITFLRDPSLYFWISYKNPTNTQFSAHEDVGKSFSGYERRSSLQLRYEIRGRKKGKNYHRGVFLAECVNGILKIYYGNSTTTVGAIKVDQPN